MSTQKLFGIGILVSLITGFVLANALSSYNGGIFMSSNMHIAIFYFFESAMTLYITGIFWLHLKHRPLFKILAIPVLLLLSFFMGSLINNFIVSPVIESIPILYAMIHNWSFNIAWFAPLGMALGAPLVFYSETAFFNWVRSGSDN